ncbi:MAG: FAD binding domain-containing protein [Chloroflexi bacterium]|nr:FAD binding domain-containing protein [Chloroflexota bacterium]
MQTFEYHEPGSISEAVALLEEYAPEASLLAGGTDLLPEMRYGKAQPRHVISLKDLPSLARLRTYDSSALGIGATTTFKMLETAGELLASSYLCTLADAAGKVGSAQIRNVGTVGGNLCHAAPSAEMAPPLLVLDAKIKIADPQGEREIALQDFFLGPGKTVLAPNEMLTEIVVPPAPSHAGAAYLRFSRRQAMDLAIVGVAVAISLTENGSCARARVALGAVAPTPIRVARAEEIVIGQLPTQELVYEVGCIAAEESRPITDARASASYRSALVAVLVRRALEKALERARVDLA